MKHFRYQLATINFIPNKNVVESMMPSLIKFAYSKNRNLLN